MAAKKGAETKVENKIRHGKWAVILPWLKRFGMRVLLVCFLLWVAAWVYLSEAVPKAGKWMQQEVLKASHEAGFAVSDILLEGRVYSDRDFISALLNTQIGDPLFAFNPHQARKLLEQMEWVKSARVERRLSGEIYIHLTERQPLALWLTGDGLFLVDRDGVQIKTDRLSRFKDLITVSGEGSAPQSPSLMQLLENYPELKARIRLAEYVGRRRWDLILGNKLRIKLPQTDPDQALDRLVDTQKEEALLDKNLVLIDLRQPEKITVRTKPGAVRDYKTKRQNSKGRDAV